MSIPQVHGITTETLQRFLVDAGAVYLDYGAPTERLLGATRGGNAFVIEQEVRALALDGAKGPVMGARRTVEVRARITARLIELTAENLRVALAGSSVTAHPEPPATKTHDRITRNRDIGASDYLTNVALVGRVAGRGQPFVGILHHALADGNFEMETEDREESVLSIQFTAHFNPANMEQEPWEIRFPVEL